MRFHLIKGISNVIQFDIEVRCIAFQLSLNFLHMSLKKLIPSITRFLFSVVNGFVSNWMCEKLEVEWLVNTTDLTDLNTVGRKWKRRE